MSEEIDIDMEVLDDGKRIVVTLTKPTEITTQEYLLELEHHIFEIAKAIGQRKHDLLDH